MRDALQAALRRITRRPWVVTGPVTIGHYARIGYTFDAPRTGAYLEADAYREIVQLLRTVSTPIGGGAVVVPSHCAVEALFRMCP